MSLPTDLSVILVTATYQSIDGTLASGGTVTFDPSDVITDSTGKVVFGRAATAGVVDGQLTTGGQPGIALPCTDNATLIPSGFSYTVTESIAGWEQRSYKIQLPSSLGETVDLSQLSAGGGGGAGVSSVNGKSGAVTLTASDVGAATLDDSGQVPASELGNVPPQYQPYQFRPESYGAEGDGIVCTVNTTAGSTTVTATPAVFTSTAVDGGKHIMIHGANGSANGPLITTIVSVTDATTAVLTAAPSATVNGCPAVFGTDDQPAVNAAVNAAGSYALSGDYFAEILFGSKIYVLASGPVQTGDGATTPTFNAQIPLPYPAANGTSRKLVIALTGAGDAGYAQFWNSLIPNVAGTSLVSMATAPKPASSTFGVQSVIGGPSGEAGFSSVSGALPTANVKAVIKGIGVWCPIWTNMSAWDFRYVAGMRAESSAAHIFAPTGVNTAAVQPYLSNIAAPAFTGSIGVGWRTPVGGNNADISMTDCAAEGYELGFSVADHFDAHKLNAIYNDVTMLVDGSQGESGTQHIIRISSIAAEAYNGGFLSSGSNIQVDIDWDSECNGTPAYDFRDDGGVHGIFRFRDPANARFPVVIGGGKVKVICDELGPGVWSSPPAVSSSAVQNTAWRDAWVNVRGGTVSAIAVDATTLTGITSGWVRVPSGHSITVTYSAAPTWQWVLD
jgi:hypothetical protein